jgi:hypothetical protein
MIGSRRKGGEFVARGFWSVYRTVYTFSMQNECINVLPRGLGIIVSPPGREGKSLATLLGGELLCYGFRADSRLRLPAMVPRKTAVLAKNTEVIRRLGQTQEPDEPVEIGVVNLNLEPTETLWDVASSSHRIRDIGSYAWLTIGDINPLCARMGQANCLEALKTISEKTETTIFASMTSEADIGSWGSGDAVLFEGIESTSWSVHVLPEQDDLWRIHVIGLGKTFALFDMVQTTRGFTYLDDAAWNQEEASN